MAAIAGDKPQRGGAALPQELGEQFSFIAYTRDGVPISCLLSQKHGMEGETKGNRKTPIAVVCHGLLNTHKSDVVRGLCSRLPYSTVTFDFRGMGHSGGNTSVGNYLLEGEDLDAVVAESRRRWKDRFELVSVIGHSKAGSVVLLWARMVMDRWTDRSSATDQDYEWDWWRGGCLSVVNLSGRFRLQEGFLQRYTKQQRHILLDYSAENDRGEEPAMVLMEYGGGKDSKLTARNPDSDADPQGPFPVREYLVRPSDVQARLQLRMEVVGETVEKFFEEGRMAPFQVRFLTVHGGQDKTIPVADAHLYDNLLKPRHELSIIPEADHFYSRPEDLDAVATRICEWVDTGSKR